MLYFVWTYESHLDVSKSRVANALATNFINEPTFGKSIIGIKIDSMIRVSWNILMRDALQDIAWTLLFAIH